ncbi:hypothetical protein TNCT_692541 [Trichonephila clavata]|uniref:Uncharacterized protein n=1 Tax=Trichonephila clavata TaxID=2740835 RepID=A0A8X6J110_TRICU|nr:hypothetical protein TNCT_692541 [Trichonephila clavata]
MKEADVETALQRSPIKSSRKLAVLMGMSHISACRTARELNLRPFKMHVVHDMKPPDFDKGCISADGFLFWTHMASVKWITSFLQMMRGSPFAWIREQSQNNRYWSATNPHIMQEWPLHDEKLSAWCAPSNCEATFIRYHCQFDRLHEHHYGIHILAEQC